MSNHRRIDFDPTNLGTRWVSYFDILGFANRVRQECAIDVWRDVVYGIEEQTYNASLYNGIVEFAWFSDTFVFYASDENRRRPFQAIHDASTWFFRELCLKRVPVRGAMAFGEFYADMPNNIFFGKAYVDAYNLGEGCDWTGFVLHETAKNRARELGQRLVDYRSWSLPNRRATPRLWSFFTRWIGRGRKVTAYLPPGPECSNPLEEMRRDTRCVRHRRKFTNALRFIRHYSSDKAKR